MPMLMLKCKTCGVIFPGHYVKEGSSPEAKMLAARTDSVHSCSRGHENNYEAEDYIDAS